MARLSQQNATNTYVIDEPFASALKRVRKALENSHLIITGELDLAGRIRKALRINIPPCVLLFASDPSLTTEEFALDLPNAALIPAHIVVSSHEVKTEVHILRCLPASEESPHHPGQVTLACLQSVILRAVESIGMRKLDG